MLRFKMIKDIMFHKIRPKILSSFSSFFFMLAIFVNIFPSYF